MPPKPKMVKEMPKPKGPKHFFTPSGFFVAITVLILAFFPLLANLVGGAFILNEWLQWLLYIWQHIIRPIVAILNVMLVALFIFLLTKILPLQFVPTLFPRTKKKAETKKDPEIAAQWAAISARAATATVENFRLAIIDADALVDAVLKQSGFEGENLAERLARVLPSEVKSVEGVWAAHRLRNDLVHTAGYVLTTEEAKAALEVYGIFLKEVGAI